MGFSLAVTSGGYSLVVVSGLLTAAASLVAVHGLQGMQASAAVARGLRSCSFHALEHRSMVVVPQLRCSRACGIFPDQGLKLCLMNRQADLFFFFFLTLSHQGSSGCILKHDFADVVFWDSFSDWSLGHLGNISTISEALLGSGMTDSMQILLLCFPHFFCGDFTTESALGVEYRPSDPIGHKPRQVPRTQVQPLGQRGGMRSSLWPKEKQFVFSEIHLLTIRI